MSHTHFERSFTRYLAAKQTVDDRALNRHVWDVFVKALPPASPVRPLRCIEVGAGIGTMIERLVTRGVLSNALYTAVDAEAANIIELNRRLVQWGARERFNATINSTQDLSNPQWVRRAASGAQRTRLQRGEQTVVIESIPMDIFELSAQSQRAQSAQTWDVLIAHAVLDLLDLSRALPQLLALLPHGVCYFTINFDGATIFEPAIDRAFDAEIERLYHQTMDERITHGLPSGDSQTGRHLFQHLQQLGIEVSAAGSSDWVVYGQQGRYPADEAYFLHFIVDTVRLALAQHPALATQRERFLDWIARRHQQIEEGQLVYIAHQLDFVGRR